MNKYETSTVDSPNRERDRKFVEAEWELSEFGDSDYEFYTMMGTLIAIGYVRMVYGDHGPYIEFEESNLIEEAWGPIKHKGPKA